MKKNKSSISKAESYEEIGDFWDKHDLGEYWGQTQEVEFETDIKPQPVPAYESQGGKDLRTPLKHAPEVFISYAREDAPFKDELAKQLSALERQGVISCWHDGLLVAGQKWDDEIVSHLDRSRIVLFLVSPDFVASDYIRRVELKRASERHAAGEVCVIPVLVRNVNGWRGEPFGELKLGDFQALPSGARFITEWPNRDGAFADVAAGIERAARELRPKAVAASAAPVPRPPAVGFVARHDAEGRDILERLREELAPDRRRMVSLWGPGGVGKTTLAAEAVRALEDDFGGRLVWTGPLLRADFSFPTLLDEIATQLGRPELRQLPPEQREENVRALLADALPLVVLDNFETIKLEEQATCAEWLAQKANCPVLVTTRERIRDANNLVLNVQIGSMSPAEAREFLGRLVKEAQDGGIFTDAVRKEIIRRSEAIPFVMQWLVAQIDLGDTARNVFEDLDRGEGDAVERVFNRSFNLPQLGDDGRDVLLALSLFVPDASHPALAAVAGFGEDTNRLRAAVHQLSALKLVRAKADETRRLHLDGLTRRLAKAHLNRDQQRATDFRQRFISYFLNYALAHKQPAPENYDALEAAKDNLLIAMDRAFSLNDWQSVGAFAYILAAPVTGMLSVRGYWNEATQRNEQALKAVRDSTNEALIPGFAHNTAIMHQYQGRVEEARRLYKESLDIARKLANQSVIAVSLNQLGKLAQDEGELDEARHLYEESLEILRRLNDQSGIAVSLHNLATLAQDQGAFDEARRLFNESLEINRKFGNQVDIAGSLYELGRLSRVQGNLKEARRLHEESLEILKRLGNRSGIATALYQLGVLTSEEGNKEEAVRLLREALVIFERLKSPNAEATRAKLKSIEDE